MMFVGRSEGRKITIECKDLLKIYSLYTLASSRNEKLLKIFSCDCFSQLLKIKKKKKFESSSSGFIRDI